MSAEAVVSDRVPSSSVDGEIGDGGGLEVWGMDAEAAIACVSSLVRPSVVVADLSVSLSSSSFAISAEGLSFEGGEGDR